MDTEPTHKSDQQPPATAEALFRPEDLQSSSTNDRPPIIHLGDLPAAVQMYQ